MPANEFTTDSPSATRPDAWLYIDEITHRVLNDYTAILAIVRRASTAVVDETSGQALEEVAARIRAAATSLCVLRPPREGHVRDLDRELEALCTALASSFLSPKGISLTLSADPVTLGAYRCWQILLIVSELVTNSARHAFQRGDPGSVTIRVGVQDEAVRCSIIDDGSVRPDAVPGRGTGIINGLICDLGGSITRNFSDAGTTVDFVIPLAEAFFGKRLEAQRRLSPLSERSFFGLFRTTGANDDDV
jgi:two-component sensor histidine kinase